MSNIQHMLYGKPVFVMRIGLYPNKADVQSVMRDYPNHIVRTEPMFNPCRFAITVARK